MDFASFVTGFVDGEGCFLISFNKRSKLKSGIEVRPSFSISQHKRNKKLVEKIHGFFRCGAMRFSRRDENYKFEVRSIHDLCTRIIPHFKQFPLQGKKQNDFQIFAEICDLIYQSKHLNSKHLRHIITESYRMNESGTRRYKQAELLRILDEMKI